MLLLELLLIISKLSKQIFLRRMFAQNGTLEKTALNKGMCIYNFAFIKGQGFYGPAEHSYQNIISVPPFTLI